MRTNSQRWLVFSVAVQNGVVKQLTDIVWAETRERAEAIITRLRINTLDRFALTLPEVVDRLETALEQSPAVIRHNLLHIAQQTSVGRRIRHQYAEVVDAEEL